MLPARPWGFYLRIILLMLLAILLNLAPRPHAARTALNQARLALQKNELSSAAFLIKEAARLSPGRSDLARLSAHYYLESGYPQQAIEILEQLALASDLEAGDLEALGDAYQQAGDILMAAAIWQHAAQLEPSLEIYRRLADYHQVRGEYTQVIEDLRQMLKYLPADASLNYRLGLVYAAVEPESGLAYLAQAAELDPSLADSALELQRKIRTATLFEEPAYTFTASGRVLATLNEWELAEAAFLQATRLRPDYAEAWAFLGEARQHSANSSGRKYPGLPDLQLALKLDASSVSANLLMGLYWSRQGDYMLANQYITTTLTLDPGNPLLHAELANTLALQGDLPAAQAAYQQAISLAPDDPFFYRLLAEFSLSHRIQIREIALPAARTAVILSPQDPHSLDILAQALIFLEDNLSAERFLLQALASDPLYAPAHLHLGMIYLERGELERGRQEFELAESLGSDSWTATQAQRYLGYYYP